MKANFTVILLLAALKKVATSNVQLLATGGPRDIDRNTVDRDLLVTPVQHWATEELPTLKTLLPNVSLRFETVELQLWQPFLLDLNVERLHLLKAQITQFGAFVYVPKVSGRLLAGYTRVGHETGHVRANITTGMFRLKQRGALPPFGEIRCSVSQIRIESSFVSETGWLYSQLAYRISEELKSHVETAICDRLREGMATVLSRTKRSKDSGGLSLLLNYTFSRLEFAYAVESATANRSDGVSVIELEGSFACTDSNRNISPIELFSFRLPNLREAMPRHITDLALYAVSDNLLNSFLHVLHYTQEFWFYVAGQAAIELCEVKECIADIFISTQPWLDDSYNLEFLIHTKTVPSITTTDERSTLVMPLVLNVYKRHQVTKESIFLFQLASDFHYILSWAVNKTGSQWATKNPGKSVALTCGHSLRSFEVELGIAADELSDLKESATLAYHSLFEKAARSIIDPHLSKICNLGIPLPLPPKLQRSISASVHHGHAHMLSLVVQPTEV